MLVLAVMGALDGCVNLADKLLLWPPSEVPTSGAERVLVPSAVGAVEVLVPHLLTVPPVGFVLRFYGNGQIANHTVIDDAAPLIELGLELWAVNYPGFGGSGGRATLHGVAVGALAAYDELARRADGKPIVVYGNSLGATAALHIAANRAVTGVVLQDPPPLRQLILWRHGWWNLWALALVVAARIPAELDSIANAARSMAPAVFIRATEDRVVPPKYQRWVRAAYAGPSTVFEVRGADHDDPLPPNITAKVYAEVGRWVRASGAVR